MITELIVNKAHCSGCGACYSSCPAEAIAMQPDEKGFAYPSVDDSKCISCGLCVKICESIGNKQITMQKAYAAFAKDGEIRKSSSSGGVFSLLAEKVLSKGGAVFGAAFNKDFGVEHICVENEEHLNLLRGSKYVQSNLRDTFREAKSRLENAQPILFSGVPCQIAGLKAYLRKEYDNLYLVELVCHGAPSPRIWEKYVELMSKKGEPKRISFRMKDSSWRRFATLFLYKNNVAYLCEHRYDPFMKGFLSNLYLRPSCYFCRLKHNNRAGDITLGDFWGAERYVPEIDDDKGLSLVFVNTERGKRLLNSILDKTTYKNLDEDVNALASMLNHSVDLNPKSEKFYRDFFANQEQLIQIIEKYTKPNVKTRCKSAIRTVLDKLGLLDIARKMMKK